MGGGGFAQKVGLARKIGILHKKCWLVCGGFPGSESRAASLSGVGREPWIGCPGYASVWEFLRLALRLRASTVAQTKAMIDMAPTEYRINWILVILFSFCDGMSCYIKKNSEQNTQACFVEKELIGCSGKQNADEYPFRDVGWSLGEADRVGHCSWLLKSSTG